MQYAFTQLYCNSFQQFLLLMPIFSVINDITINIFTNKHFTIMYYLKQFPKGTNQDGGIDKHCLPHPMNTPKLQQNYRIIIRENHMKSS